MSEPKPNPFVKTARDYAAACARAGMPGGAVWGMDRYRRLFREGVTEGVDVPMPAVPEKIIRSESSEGTVTKFTQRVPRSLSDPAAGTLETESVIIPMVGRKGILTHTLCVSSQVGCAMGCGFCQTAQMGLIRSLTVEEIVGQWFTARHALSEMGGKTIGNIVFMGMGEPMDNLDAVIGAIAVLTEQNGIGLPMSKITISTVGRIDGLKKLGEQVRTPGWHRLNLAVSLNAPNDAVRSTIMPINRAMPMRALREAILAWPIYGGAKICFEYVLIPGVNDAPEHMQQLADYMQGCGEWAEAGGESRGLKGLVNLIPYNPREDSPWQAPSEEQVVAFLRGLLARGVVAKRRRTKGRDQMAACGQLGNLEYRRKKVRSEMVTLNVSR